MRTTCRTPPLLQTVERNKKIREQQKDKAKEESKNKSVLLLIFNFNIVIFIESVDFVAYGRLFLTKVIYYLLFITNP